MSTDCQLGNWRDSLSIVSDYRLENHSNGVRSLAEAKNFSSSVCVQTGSEAQSDSYLMGTGAPFPEGEA
jgi:hypothetical protein